PSRTTVRLSGPAYNSTRRIRSSSDLGSARPSVLLVVTHSTPSGAAATARIRPYFSAKYDFGLPAFSPSSGTPKRHCPRKAPTNAVERTIARPAGDDVLVGSHTAFGSVYSLPPPLPSTCGQP